MKSKKRFLTLTFAFMLAFAGCASLPSTQYFVLASPPSSPSETQNKLTIQHVQLPSYLAQPGIALSVAPHQVLHAQYHRWAEPLEEGVQRLLRRHLERGFDQQPLEAVVALQVRHFHGDVRGRVLLDVDWQVEGPAFARSDRYFAQVQQKSNGYTALVAAQATLVEQLAAEMVAALQSDLLTLGKGQ